MRHPRTTFAGSAMAAALAFAATLFVVPSGTRVEAAMILNSFRQTAREGFKLSVENISQDGIIANATIAAAMDPFAAGGQPDVEDVKSLYLEANVTSEDNTDIPWEHIHVVFAMRDQNAWAFLKMSGLRDEEMLNEPIMAVLNGYFEGGVLLKLDGLMDMVDEVVGESLDGIFNVSAEIQGGIEEGLKEAVAQGALEADGDIKVVIDQDTRKISVKGVQGADADLEGLQELAQELDHTFSRLMTGKATGDDLAALAEKLTEAAGEVNVEQVERGVHVLTAGGFKFRELAEQAGEEADAEELAFVEHMALQMRYREGAGVESARISHLGPLDGSVTFESADAALLSELIDLDRIVGQHRPLVLDLSQLEPLIKAALEQAQQHVDDAAD